MAPKWGRRSRKSWTKALSFRMRSLWTSSRSGWQSLIAKMALSYGVPRTLSQAEAIDAKGIRIDHVISLEIDDEVIKSRMGGRRVCTHCGATYHIVNNPPKTEGICDLCGESVAIRKDDQPETVQHRLDVYHASTEVLKDYYAKQGKLRTVCGDQAIRNIYGDILTAIGEKS